MKTFNNHIILTLIAVFATNVFFLMWIIIDSYATQRTIIDGMSFYNFLAISNTALLVISGISATYKSLGDLIIKKGFSSGFRFIVKTMLSVAVFYSSCLLAAFAHHFFMLNADWFLSLEFMEQFATNNYLVALVVFFSFTSVLMFIISNLERRSGNVTKLLLQSMGQIIKPNLVNRGFMFIDLNDATSIAENLSSQKYANLLRDCFRMLDELVDVSPFEIYQYVGDEAVITWDVSIPKADIKAVQLFDDFKAYLRENKHAFAKAYHIQPRFKCAIHSGQVVQSEIGNEVKHLVYHGDVLNTTARLLSYCHKVKTDCIISKDALHNNATLATFFSLAPIMAKNLKGKTLAVEAFKILEKQEANSILITTKSTNLFSPTKVTDSHILKFYET